MGGGGGWKVKGLLWSVLCWLLEPGSGGKRRLRIPGLCWLPNPSQSNLSGSGENPETKTFITRKYSSSTGYHLLSVYCRVVLCFTYI